MAGALAAGVVRASLLSPQGRCSCPRVWATGCFYDVFIFTCVSCHFFKKANRTIVSQYNCLSVFFISFCKIKFKLKKAVLFDQEVV